MRVDGVRRFWRQVLLLAVMSAMSLRLLGVTMDYGRFTRENGHRTIKDLNARGWRCLTNDDIDSAAAYYAVTISRYSEKMSDEDVEHVGRALINTAYIRLFIRNKPEQAWPLLNTALRIGEEHALPLVKIGAGENLAKIYADYNNVPKALHLYREAIDEAVDNRLDWGVTMTFIDMVTVAVANGGLTEIKESIGKVRDYGFAPDAQLGRYCHGLALAAEALYGGRPRDAISILNESAQFIDPIYGKERYEVNHAFITGMAWLAAGDSRNSVLILKETADRAIAGGFTDMAQTVYDRLSEAYREAGMPDESGRIRLKSLQIRDSLYSAGKYEVIKDLEAESALEDIRKEMTDARIREEKIRMAVIIVSLGVGVAMILLVLLSISYRRVKRSNRELFRKNMELASAGVVTANDPPEVPAESGTEEAAAEACRGEMKALFDEICGVIESSPEVYTPEFSLDRLSELTGIRSQQISQAVAVMTGKNLSALIARQRINRACCFLADRGLSEKMTIETIAENVGYKSRTHFSKIFKIHTGLSPKEFMRQARLGDK